MRHFLNEIEVAPRNILDFGVLSTFTGEPNILQVDADKVVLPREAKEIIDQHIQSVGFFEGIPYRIEMGPNISLNYYVDLTEDAVFRDYEIEVKIKRRNAYDNFFDQANGTSFELMAEKGVFFPTTEIDYLIIKDNQTEIALTLALGTITISKALADAVLEFSSAISDLIEASTPIVGVSAAGPTVSYNTGAIITASLNAIAQLAYIAFLTVALVNYVQELIQTIYPPLLQMKGCKLKNLVERGCDYLGYTLQSDLLQSLSNLVVLPVPLETENSIFFVKNGFGQTKTYPSASDTVPTLGLLIDAIEQTFNARTRVANGVVQIERRDYWSGNTQNQIIPALNLQDDRQSEIRYNTDEAWKRTYIHYLTDYSDIHTIDNFSISDAEYSTEKTNVVNSDLVTIKGVNDVQIPFAMGIRKNRLTFVEEIVKGFLVAIDAVINIFGGNGNYQSTVLARVGCMVISQAYYSQTKLIYAQNSKIAPDWIEKQSAAAFYDDYHKINEIQVNGYKVLNDAPVRLTANDFVNLLNNNFAQIDGIVCEILSIRFNDEKSLANITYRIPFNYANGQVEVITLND
jgi:hypothetical protein